MSDLLADDHILLHFNNVPYPDDIMYGLVFGCTWRILPEQQQFSVYYDENLFTREQGSEETIIHVTWE